jgi:DNA polymerase/3'-5' exonuclease PolX
MNYLEAIEIANRVKFRLMPHCDRCEIAGSVRRRKSECKDIEIVAIPKDYEVGLFAKGIGLVLREWGILKGKPGPDCRYLQIRLPDGINLDLFFAEPENWGLIYLIRTGPWEYSKRVIGSELPARGYHSVGGQLMFNSKPIPVREEEDLYRILGTPFLKPEFRL